MNRLFYFGIVLGLVLSLTLSTDTRARTIYMALPSPIVDGNLEYQIRELRAAQEGDQVLMVTDSPGGSVNEMVKMLRALRETKATVTCQVRDFAASAAAIITVSCDKFVMEKGSVLLFHLPSRYYSIGAVELFTDKITVDDWCPAYANHAINFANFMQSIGIRRMMTEQQWQDMLYGADIVLTPEEIIENLRR